MIYIERVGEKGIVNIEKNTFSNVQNYFFFNFHHTIT